MRACFAPESGHCGNISHKVCLLPIADGDEIRFASIYGDTIVQGIGVPPEGVALILGVDRILDMTRTAVNVSGDLTASVVMERWLSESNDSKCRADNASPSGAE